MHWLLGGYLWLYVHRPFEYYPLLGDLQLERVYFLIMLGWWLVTPNKAWLPNRLHGAFLAFTAALLLCWLASPFRERCWDTVENYLKVALFSFLVVTTVRDERGLRRIIAMFLLAVGLYMGHSMLEYHFGRIEWRQGISRMVGVDVTYRDPNAFASTLLLALPLTLPFYDRATTLSKKLPLWLFTGAAAVCVLLTGSRTGFVGLIVFALFCLILAKNRLKLALLFGTAALVAVVAMPDFLLGRFLTLIDPSYGPHNAQESAEGRLSGLLDGIALWNQNPVVGVGPGAFAYATGQGFNPHNVYGQVLAEMGTVGVAAFLGILVCFLLNWLETRRAYRRHPEWPRDFLFQTSRSVSLCVVLLLFLGMAGHNLYRYNWLWFAAFQMVALHCVRQKVAAGERLPPRLPYFTNHARRPRGPRPVTPRTDPSRSA